MRVGAPSTTNSFTGSNVEYFLYISSLIFSEISIWVSLLLSYYSRYYHYYYCHLVLLLSPECLLNFLPNLYVPPLSGKSFEFMVFKILGNAFAIQKIESRYLCSSSSVKIYSSGRKTICYSKLFNIKEILTMCNRKELLDLVYWIIKYSATKNVEITNRKYYWKPSLNK